PTSKSTPPRPARNTAKPHWVAQAGRTSSAMGACLAPPAVCTTMSPLVGTAGEDDRGSELVRSLGAGYRPMGPGRGEAIEHAAGAHRARPAARLLSRSVAVFHFHRPYPEQRPFLRDLAGNR